MNAPAALGAAPALPLVQTFEMLSEGQRAAMKRIVAHDAAPAPQIEFTTPASMFISDERHAAEQEHLFRARAVPLAVSALVAEPGTAMGHDALGIPLIISRDKQGDVHVFLNACQHKGAKLLESCDPVKAARMTCPYHAWTFGLDGKLLAVARPETFANLDKSSRNLAELPAREHGGIIWVMLDRKAQPDFSALVPELAADLEALDLPRLHVYGRERFEIAANWKLVLEPFLEGYHVQRLHAATVGPMFADVPNVVDLLGPTIRQISGKANFAPADLDIEGENIHKTVTTVYNMFPNCVVITSPWYISVMLLHPRAANHTTVEYHMLTRAKPDNAKAEELYAKSYAMILNVFGNEDFRAAEISHAGLATGALDTCVYSGLEASIATYYGVMADFLPA